MKNKYGIGFFAVTIIAVLMITCAYQFTFQKAKERAQAEQKTEEEKRDGGRGRICYCGRRGTEGRLLLSDGSQRICGGLLKRPDDSL